MIDFCERGGEEEDNLCLPEIHKKACVPRVAREVFALER